MSSPAIDKYYTSVQKIKDWGGSHKETAIRQAFITLLNHYAEKKDLFLITELAVEGKHGKKVMPDGTLKNALRLDYGYWESKDEADVIDDEIEKKFKKGYPDRNILFEDSQTAVLIQEGREVQRVSFKDADKLDSILNAFVNHKHPEARKFEEALEHFKADLPTILETLRDRIETARKGNPKFIAAASTFWTLTKHEINPDITEADIREMMIQHILTADIFNKIFDEPDFHQHNNIASELEKLIGTLFSYSDRKNLLAALEHYYEAINAAAASIKDHHEKQQFLKVLYENFYKVYNPKMADRLGVVYTPNEIVRFMIRSVDQLLHRHFGKTLSSRNVEIMDPATGMGTFICDIIDHLPKQDLDYKYKNELHANEVAILPYYVANLNIEYTFKQKMGYYAEFPSLCFVDTLDNTGALQYSGKQEDMFGLTSENAARIKRQNTKKISVFIGNPPYNAKQEHYNSQNSNRKYDRIDERIRNTYVRYGSAQNQIGLYDMFVRFIRWASDRLSENGIVAFVSNSAFVDMKAFDGLRKCLADEYSDIYVINLKGNARTSGEQRKREGGSIFSDQIRVGVAIYFLVKRKHEDPVRVHYNEVDDYLGAAEKKDYLAGKELRDVDFRVVIPDAKHNWLTQTDNDFEGLVALVDKGVKAGKGTNAIFKLFTRGVESTRDEWVYDSDKGELKSKVKFMLERFALSAATKKMDPSIKWSPSLEADLMSGRAITHEPTLYRPSLYRPYCKAWHYASKPWNHRLTDNHYQLFGPQLDKANTSICFITGIAKPFSPLATDGLMDMNCISPAAGGSFMMGMYVYAEDGTRHDNLTDWGLAQFTTHYAEGSLRGQGPRDIKKEDVFHYVYAVLHDPVYREKYALNLKREFPRIPFYADFWQWSTWGKQLMDLHIGYETAEPYPLELVSSDTKAEAKKKKKTLLDSLAEPEPLYGREFKVKVKLKADKEAGIIELDELTLLKGIPKEAWAYKLGNRSALEWVLDQYKEKKPSDPTIAEKFNTYRFADYKEKVIDLLKRVTTVSVGTVEVVRGMSDAQRKDV